MNFLRRCRSLTAWVALLSAGGPVGAAPFTPGNLVIYRVGNGSSSLVSTGNPVFLDEFTPAGSLVQSIPLPTVPTSQGRRLVANGTSTSEGQLTRSADGRFLVATGYDVTIPYVSSLSGTAASSVFRSIARVNSSGTVNTSTFLQDFADGGTPRSATSLDGSSFWMAGSTGGVRYAPFGATNSSTRLNASNNSLRQVLTFDGQLYVSSGGTQTSQLTSVGVGLPTTTGQTLDSLPGLPPSGVAYGFFFADLNRDIPGSDTLYVADDTVGLTKYSLVGGNWTSNGTIGTNADDYRGLTAIVSGSSVTLFSIRKAQGAAGGGEFVQLTDDSGYSGSFAGVPTLRATAAANTAFRGIAPTPFVGSDLVADLAAPATANTGESFDYIFTVKNIGNVAAGDSISFFQFSDSLVVDSVSSTDGVPNVFAGPETNLATLELLNGLAPGASAVMTVTVAAATPGTYSVSPDLTVVDGLNGVIEVNEFNNQVPYTTTTVVSNSSPVAPAITSQPDNQAITNGGTATLTVAASGVPEPTFQWFVGSSGDTSNPVIDAVFSSFTTPPLTTSAEYWVRASNASGMADSNTVVVDVAPAPAPEIAVRIGTDPEELANGATLDFGASQVGFTGSTRVIRISNLGDEHLASLGVSLNVGDVSDFALDLDGFPSFIAPRQFADITLTFAPTAAGSRSAGLVITSNDADESPFTVNLSGNGIGPVMLGSNSLLNGDAELGLGATSSSDIVDAPGWTSSGNSTVVNYDVSGFPTAISAGPADRGLNFFAGGPSNSQSSMTQMIDVSSIIGQVNSGLIGYELSGFFGGFSTQADNSRLRAEFLAADDSVIATAVAGPILPAERDNTTGLVYRSIAGSLPNATRAIRVTLEFNRITGSYNDGYADNLGLVLFPSIPPLLTEQPASQTIVSGTTATLTVVALGAPSPTFQWYSGLSGDTSNPILGAISPSFTTPSLTNNARYWVRASNIFGTADSATATVGINHLVNGSFEMPAIGGNLLSVSAPNSTTLVGWSVSQGDVEIIRPGYWPASDGLQSLDMSGVSAGAIFQTVTGLIPGATYRLSFDLSGNPFSGSAPLKRLSASAGGSTTTFDFDTSPYTQPFGTVPDMGWQTRSLSFVSDGTPVVIAFESLSLSSAGPALDNVALVVTDDPVVVVSSDAKLSGLTANSGILSPPFAPLAENYELNVPNSVSNITLNPTLADPNASLKINGVDFPSGSETTPFQLEPGPNVISLVVTAEDAATTRTYTINATRSEPLIVITEPAGSVTASGTQLNGTVNPRGSAIAYFEYGTTTSYGAVTAGQAISGSSLIPVTANLSGITGGTLYHYRMVAIGADGVIVGNDMTFTTGLEVPVAATGSPVAVSDTGATLVGAISSNGLPVEAFFEYGLTTLYGSSTDIQSFPAGSSLKDVLHPITGLLTGANYHYRIVATSAAGTTFGRDVSFVANAGTSTGTGVPTSVPNVTTLDTAAIGTNSAELLGHVNPNGGTTVVQFEFGTSTSYGRISEIQGVGNGTEIAAVSLPASGLNPGTLYHYRLTATNSLGTSAGADGTFTTQFLSPVVSTGSATALSTTTANIEGTVRARNTDTEVFFDYGTNPSILSNSIVATPSIVSGDTFKPVSAQLPDLVQGTTYYYRIRAVNSGGAGLGAVKSFDVGALSGLFQQFPDEITPLEHQGTVSINLTPGSIGSGWRFAGEQAWRATGTSATGLARGDRVIEYRPVPGYVQPIDETVVVLSEAAPVTLGRSYTPTAEVGTSGLTITLKPESLASSSVPVETRAQWRFFGESNSDWKDSGTTVAGLIAGDYVIECKPVAGRTTPPAITASVADGSTTSATITYFITEDPVGTPPGVLSFELVSTSEERPFAYVGQITSDVGASTGFVVRPRVVATAGHVVFDDGTLAATTGIQWLFQRDQGVHEPAPKLPRGYYLLSGYASQRAADNSPGTSTPESQNLDAAALYFSDDAGRSGFSGYLASDSTVNEFVVSSSLKTLVGYPVDGITPANQGRVHATPLANVTFGAAFGQTYTTSGIRSSGGNSGGPLCVQHVTGVYYPAAIYLGGTAQTVVRAIDGSVVDLFGFAEASANSSAGVTGGSLTQSGTSSIGTPTLGAIRVNIEPAAARAAGAGWRIQAQADYSASGAQIVGLSPNNYTVQFANVAGFVPPASQALMIQGGQLTTITFTYEEIISPPVITSPNTLTLTRGQPILYQIAATNSPTFFSQLGALPTGASFDAVTGIVSGTTQEAGNFPITIGAGNSGGADSRVVNLTVRPVIQAQSLTIPYQQPASYQIVSSESGEGVSHAVSGLPVGLSLQSSTGLITGTPTVAGVYSVPISVTRNGATANAVLTINVTGTVPVITQQPPSTKSVEFGVSTTLTVAASGLPEPTYQWYRGARGVTDNPVPGATSSTFTTPPVTSDTSYWARAISISGSADSTATAIQVLPSSNPKLSFLGTNAGGLGAAFNAAITSYSLNVPFSLSGINLIPVVQVAQTTVEIAGSPVASGTPSEVIPLAVGENIIQVVSTAGDGVSTLTYTLRVTRAPSPVIETAAATLITDISATLNGNVVPNSQVRVLFQYGTTPAYGNITAQKSVSGAEQVAVQFPVVGLVGDTTYHYRFVALAGAEIIVGEDMSFTTSRSRPLAATGSPAAVSTSQATLIGAVNPLGQATEAYFEYGTSPSFGNVTPTQNISSGTGVVDILEVITGLTPGATYYYRIVASSPAGISFGETVSFPAISGGGSGDGVVDAPPTVTTGAAADITTESAALLGVVNPNDGTTFVFFEYGTTNSYGSSTASEGVGNGTEPANVTIDVLGLNPGATYHYRLVATNSLGTVAGSDATFTAGYLPPIASTGPATALSSTSATVTGSVRARGISTEAWIDYGTDGVTFPNSVRATPQTVVGDLEVPISVDLTNLNGAQTYYYRIRGESSGGTGTGNPQSLQIGALLGFEQSFTREVPAGDFEGQLVVNLLPEGIGSWRFTGESQWRLSGRVVGGMTSGEREIEFQPVTGYIQPQQEIVGVVSGESAVVLDRIYYESNTAGTGVLRVLLAPASLAGPEVPEASRLQWRLAGGDDPSWLNSGDELTGLLGGSYLIECKPVPGKNTPNPANHLVTKDETTTASITYFAASAPLFNPPSVVPFSTASSSQELPYAYVGQVRSGTGLYSGFVVKPRVVATVAQAVFDDATLAATNNTQWLLQRDKGSYEPDPQTPRGFYIFTGYDAQRAAEKTPGTLAVESQNLNVAALYFAADAGRGGFSGFLASDDEENEFLQSNDLKTLVGYPVNGIASTNQGRMHATAASGAAFSPVFGRTYTSPAIRGIGGMMGGPLCVRYQEGAYYPAAIYVGGTNVGAVRAIDSDVIDIFTRAEISGNGGDNNTGGGITHSSFASIGALTEPSALQVTIEPAVARNAGAGWRLLPETTFRPSGNQKSGLNAGTYKLEFINVSGFDAPAEQSVTLDGGQLVQITYTYQTGNTAPTISGIADQTVAVNSTAGPLSFTISDAELSASSLILTKSSSNKVLIPDANVVFGGSGTERTATITPTANRLGTSTITIKVSDGNLMAERRFSFTVTGLSLETWRFQNFGTSENIGDAADDADPDRDGMINADEFAAGTNPNSGSDFFKVAAITRGPGTCTVTSSGKAGRLYTLERRDTVGSEPWITIDSTGPLISDDMISLTDSAATSNSAIYRLRVSVP